MLENIIHQSEWTQSALGQKIELYRKGHTTQHKKNFLFIGGVHGDEPEGVELAEKFLIWLKNQNQDEIHNWTLIPCLNPDGYHQSERTNGNGVDLNRNFATHDWTPSFKAPRYYPGEHAESEPEVKALSQLIRSEKFDYIIHFHSWEPCVVYTGAPGKKIAEILTQDNGYRIGEDIGYPTPGSLGQFGWYVHKTPVICIEEKEKIELSLVWDHFKSGLLYLMRESL